jgi:thiosulfate/3-mercaptopyruvate sulfurtransferase
MLPLLMEPEDFEPHLDDKNLLLVDLCTPENYASSHLPGAVHVSPADLVSGIKPATGKLPDTGRLHSLFSSIGYHRDRQIVVYDDEGGGWAGRFIWTLDVIGHLKSSYINGGLIAWNAANLPVTSEAPMIDPVDVVLQIDRSVIAEKSDVLISIEDPDTLIWDARSAEEYSGTKVLASRGGHIPGAINLDWLDTMDRRNNLKLMPEMQALLDSHGISTEKSIITHCQTHHRSGLTYLIGKILGYDIRAYHGSWSEWGNDPDTPVET